MASSDEQVQLGLLPMPVAVDLDPTETARSDETVVHWKGESCARLERRLESLPSVGTLELDVADITEGIPQLGVDESYRLEKTNTGWILKTASVFGALAGVTTLKQLYRSHAAQRVQSIDDQPRYPWRGVLIDVARHFISIETLRHVVDGMAELKMNVLHLHLTDDQAFRFECRSYPLASGEHLKQQALKDLVAYAADHGVRIVPEIDVPGHVTAWLVALPELGLQQVDVTDRFGVHKACLDPTRERTYEVLHSLFTELAEVFPDEYVHIGGDEVHPAWWGEDPAIAELMQAQGLADLRAVQNHFTQRVVAILSDLGKRAIGWDEVLHPDMPELVVQNWRGATTRDRAAEKGLATIVSAPYYLDLFFPLDYHYAFDPSADQDTWLQLEDDQQSDLRLAHVAKGIEWTKQWRNEAIDFDGAANVLGGEACLWSELVDEHTLRTRLWSRLPAVAERLWSTTPTSMAPFYERAEQILDAEPFFLRQRQQQTLAAIGLSPDQIEIALLLEPVKWYGRLLGQTALEARIAGSEMPQARPYQVDTPLNRVVDFIAPESLSARALGTSIPWADFVAMVEAQNPQSWPEDVRPAIEGLKSFAAALKSELLTESQARALYVPHGEFMLAPVYCWIRQVLD